MGTKKDSCMKWEYIFAIGIKIVLSVWLYMYVYG